MKEFKCNVAQIGFFAGPVFTVSSLQSTNSNRTVNKDEELTRFYNAQSTLKMSIVSNRVSKENEKIKKTVLDILADLAFVGRIERKISEKNLDAKVAISKSADELVFEMGNLDSEYIRSRKDDIKGVADMLISIINGNNGVLSECSCITAAEISPAQLSSLDESLLGAVLTDKGSPNSHASILAGNIGIPYLYGNPDAVNEAKKAEFIIVDAETSLVITDPDAKTKKEAEKKMSEVLKNRKNVKSANDEPIDLPSTKTKVYANIEGPQDIDALLKSGADGVGLFRTEFLFIGKEKMPSENEQYEAYRKVLEAMGDKEVIIRTMDIGSDKKVSFIDFPEESNPALGLRGARVSLERKELFDTQLRALLRAGKYGNLKVMFPMIASSWEIDEIKDKVEDTANQLKKENIEYKIPKLGIMVETPAAAVLAEEFAKKVDFFSIGTNDLTQYTIALDRESQGLDRYFNPKHEAVLKLIKMTAKGSHKEGIETGVCGQLAANPETVKLLIESGVDELSVAIRKVGDVKKLVAKAEEEIEKNEESQIPCAVADGEIIPMEEIPDPVFSGGTMGECFGIMPSNGKVYAPVSGKVIGIAETSHAVTFKTENGSEILVHVGINTVNLNGKGFKLFVKTDETVEQNQIIMDVDIKTITDAGYSPMIIIVTLN